MVAVSNLFLFACFTKWQVLKVYIPIATCYMLARAFRKEWWMPVVNFIVVVALLSVSHLYRQFGPGADVNSYSLDITGPLMMMVMKLTSFAFDMHDARRWSMRRPSRPVPTTEDITKAPPSEKTSKGPIVEPASKFAVIRKYPTVLEFLGYALLFPGLLAGPVVPFYEYRTFINGTYFAGIDVTRNALTGRKRRALYLFIVACSSLVMYVCLKPLFEPSYMFHPDFMSRPWWYRALYVHMSNLVFRSKYYFAWMMAEGSYVIIGLGFRLSSTKKPLWDRLENVNPIRIESTADFRLLVSQWNVFTNQWLNAYVYRRLQKYFGKGTSSSRASMITYIVSSLWHGFYPGYYLVSASAAWMTLVSRSMPFASLYLLFSDLQEYYMAVWQPVQENRVLRPHVYAS
ncbi:Lysophospholipid acyltransferase [Paramicrosporidium saccamoebae]|uniref:Lysophospholipid acyltransferase n=1 Tax=Paramicrosporidium saccamoebae TaxID=1246581 RepID=A0A2H9TQ40_9FUNG|nr:Lysophospholipid acyltransferase [Paramicrosporidium saccamoebae]